MDRTLPYHFPRGTDACFGRVYGEAFLKAHPGHRVAELYVYHDLSPDPPGNHASTRAEKIAADRVSRDELSVTVMARFKDAPGTYDRDVTCADGLVGISCFADCDGASFDMYPDGRGLVLDRKSLIGRIHLNGSCGGSAGRSAWLRLKTDGVDYRLDPKPPEACAAVLNDTPRTD